MDAYKQRTSTEKMNLFIKITRLRENGHSANQACEIAGIHRSLYYRWWSQIKAWGELESIALESKSRAPKHRPRRTPQHVIDTVIQLAKTGYFQSANALTKHLRESHDLKITNATTIKILEDAGLFGYETHYREGQRVKKRKIMSITQKNLDL